MNQKKIGEFLKDLRKAKGLTQEQLAEQFYISSRTVSRWETGSNMPDINMLIDLAEFYNVDIHEIIDGERKSEKMENDEKTTLKKVAEYAENEKENQKLKIFKIILLANLGMIVCSFLFGPESKGLLNGIISEGICDLIMGVSTGITGIALVTYFLFSFYCAKCVKKTKKNKEK